MIDPVSKHSGLGPLTPSTEGVNGAARRAGAGAVGPVAGPSPTPAADNPRRNSAGISDEVLQAALARIADFVAPHANLEFSIDEATEKRVVKVIDSTTGDVIRQFPSEEALAIAQSLDRLKGLLLQQKA